MSPPDPTFTLQGIVTSSATGNPRAGVEVESIEGVNRGLGMRTGTNGRYLLERLKPGTMKIRATGTDYAGLARKLRMRFTRAVELYRRDAADWILRDRFCVSPAERLPIISDRRRVTS
jgi:hypothetical protein